MIGTDLKWLIPAGSLDGYVVGLDCLDKMVWAVDCDRGRSVLALHNGIPYRLPITPAADTSVTLIVDVATYRTNWGLLNYATVVGFPKHNDRLQTRIGAAGLVCSDIPEDFMHSTLLPLRIGNYSDILKYISL